MADKRGISGRAMARLSNNLGAPTFVIQKTLSGNTTAYTVVDNAPFKFRVLDMHVVLTGGAGDSGDTVQLFRNTTAITNALDCNTADKSVVRAGTIDDSQHELSIGDDLKITAATGVDTDLGAEVYILCTRV